MFEKAEKEELCQISLTGIRSLVLLGLLIQAPRSLEEIRSAFMEYNIMEDSNSDDILRIDLNTLKTMGCEISRADHRTNNKFVLLDHPFKIDVTEDEFKILKRAFNKIKENADVAVLMQYDELFKKISEFVSDKTIKEEFLGLSAFKNYSPEIVKELRFACKKNYEVKLIYKEPLQKKEIEKEIIAEKLGIKNDKLYLYGIDKNTKGSVYLNIKRILKILSQKDNEDNLSSKPVTVKFFVKEFGYSGLDDCETIISGDISEGFVIEGKYHNEFYATQRILSFGSKCTVIEPANFKDRIVEVLKRMRDVYNG